MTTPTLTDIVAEIEPILRRTLSRLCLTWQAGEPTVRLTCSLWLDSTAGTIQTPQHVVTVDTESLPEGITLTGWIHWPDLTRSVASHPDAETQIRDLSRSGLVGHLDATRVQGGGPIRWSITTHAGSEAERHAWVRSLRQLTPDEAARELGISRPRLYQLMDAGRLPYTTAHGRRLIRAWDLDSIRQRPGAGRPRSAFTLEKKENTPCPTRL